MARKDVIAELETILSTNLAEFKRDMTAASEAVKSSTSRIKKDLDDTNSGFGKVSAGIGTFLKSAGALAGVVTGAAVGFGYLVKTQIDYASSLVDTADKLHISTDSLQLYRKVAEDTGVTNETLESSFNKFVKNVGELQSGQGSLASSLDKTNIALKRQLEGAESTDEAFNIIMKALAGMEPGFKQNALAMDAFGKSGAGMVVMVKDGAAAFDAQIERIKALGIVIDEDLLRSAESAGDSLADLTDVISAQFTTALISLAPAITKVTGEATKWIVENRALIDQRLDEYVEKVSTAIEGFDYESFGRNLVTVVDGLATVIGKIAEIPTYLEKTNTFLKAFVTGPVEHIRNMFAEKIPEAVEETTKSFKDVERGVDSVSKKLDDLKEPDPIQIKVDAEEAQTTLDLLKIEFAGFEDLTIPVKADTSQAESEIKKTWGLWDGKVVEFPVTADTSQAEDETNQFIDQIKNIKAEVLIGGDPKEALAQLKELKSQIESEQAMVALGADPTIAEDTVRDLLKDIQEAEAALKILADASPAEARVKELVDAVNETTATIRIEADVTEASAAVQAFIDETGIAFEELSADMIDALDRGLRPIRDAEGNRIAGKTETKKSDQEVTKDYSESKNVTQVGIPAGEFLNKIDDLGIEISNSKRKALEQDLKKIVYDVGHEYAGLPMFAYAQGTGLSGLLRDGPVFAHQGEIILTKNESDVLRQASSGGYNYVNNNQRKINNNYNIIVNQQVVGDRPAMTAREMANELAQRINQQKVRFGEAA